MSAENYSTGLPLGQCLPNGLGDPALKEDDPTIGYMFNHTMLRIRDPKASLKFYVDIMGMRTVFVQDLGPVTVYYLGYPRTPEHRQDLSKFGNDTFANLVSTMGLIELTHTHGAEYTDSEFYASNRNTFNQGFGHLGFTVPDVPAAVERLRSLGVKIVSFPLHLSQQVTQPFEREKGLGWGSQLPPELAIDAFALIEDPDGNTIELVSQTKNPMKINKPNPQSTP